jgi:hypothetical protein
VEWVNNAHLDEESSQKRIYELKREYNRQIIAMMERQGNVINYVEGSHPWKM